MCTFSVVPPYPLPTQLLKILNVFSTRSRQNSVWPPVGCFKSQDMTQHYTLLQTMYNGIHSLDNFPDFKQVGLLYWSALGKVRQSLFPMKISQI